VRTLLFSGRDLWRNGVFLYGGLLQAPGGFERDGLLLKLVLSGGAYRYTADALGGERVTGAEWLVQGLLGWRVKRGNAEVKVFVGPEFQHHRLWPDDPGNKLNGSAFGLRFAAELWTELAPATVVIGDVALSTVATSHSARLAYGRHVLENIVGGFYVGPEIQYFAADGYRHLRLGAHITGLKLDNLEWSAAGGWAGDSDRASGAYVRLGLVTRASD
jgi:hypothetical protein